MKMTFEISGIVRFLLLILCLPFVGCGQGTDIILVYEGELTGKAGITLAENALSKVIGENHGYLPVEYKSPSGKKEKHVAMSVEFAKDNPDMYFARNIKNSNRGHVLWGRLESDLVWEYSVMLELEGVNVKCKVIKAK
jgi:hypothetical protein